MFGRHSEDHSLTGSTLLKPKDEPRNFGGSTINPRPQAKCAMEALNMRGAFFCKVELWSPYQ